MKEVCHSAISGPFNCRARLRRVASDRLDRTGGELNQPARADAGADCRERAPDHGEAGLVPTGSSVKGILDARAHSDRRRVIGNKLMGGAAAAPLDDHVVRYAYAAWSTGKNAKFAAYAALSGVIC